LKGGKNHRDYHAALFMLPSLSTPEMAPKIAYGIYDGVIKMNL